MKITVSIQGAENTIQRFSGMDGKVRSAIRSTIETLCTDLQRHVIADKLSGDPLKRRSGDLSRSVYKKVENGGMSGVVGANTPYAHRQEYGFTGTESVREYVRRSREQMKSAVFNKLGLETRSSKARGVGTGEIVVQAHSRKVDYPAHSYLRSALADYRERIDMEIESAVRRAIA